MRKRDVFTLVVCAWFVIVVLGLLPVVVMQ